MKTKLIVAKNGKTGSAEFEYSDPYEVSSVVYSGALSEEIKDVCEGYEIKYAYVPGPVSIGPAPLDLVWCISALDEVFGSVEIAGDEPPIESEPGVIY